MKKFCQYLAIGLFSVFLFGFISCQPNPPGTSTTANTTTNSSAPKSDAPLKTVAASFPDFGFMVSPTDYINKYSNEPIFKLKADFPTDLPPEASMPAFMKIDFKTNPKEYIMADAKFSARNMFISIRTFRQTGN